MKKILKNNRGFSLIEMIVAVSVFSFLVVIISDMFLSMLNSQRRSISIQNTQESMRYAFEVMSKEIRHAQRSDTDCYSGASKRMYNTNNDNTIIYFKNKNGECVSYALINGALLVRRDSRAANLTPSSLVISGLSFDVMDNDIIEGSAQEIQPRVTLKMRVGMKFITLDSRILYMQTSVTSRYYE
jgi:prepilin-type N-terminal cleavage/methylation domain-containing protein